MRRLWTSGRRLTSFQRYSNILPHNRWKGHGCSDRSQDERNVRTSPVLLLSKQIRMRTCVNKQQYQLLVVLFPNQQPIWSYVTFPKARISYTILHSIRLFIKTSMSRVSNKVSSWAAFMASSSISQVYVNPFCIILQILFSVAKIMQIIYSIKKNIKKSYFILYCLRLALY